MKPSLFILFILSLQITAISQSSYSLSGLVKSNDTEKIAFGEILIYRSEEAIPFQLNTIEDGKFKFESLNAGEYKLEFKVLGYETLIEYITIDKDKTLNVLLKKGSNELDEITISAKRNIVQNENGNLSLQVTNFEEQTDVIALLSLFPGVIVSPDGEGLTVVGKGAPLLYLGKQRINNEVLISIPVESIQSIKIINNPSAKYEANGRAVLLITRKKSFADGINLSVSNRFSERRNDNNYSNFNGSLKKNKVELRTNFSYNHLNPWEGSTSSYTVLNENIEATNDAISSGPRRQYLMGLGAYYDLSKQSYLSANINYRTQYSQAPIIGNSSFIETQDSSYFNTKAEERSDRYFLSSNINYNNVINDKNEVFIGLQYTDYFRGLISDIADSINGNPFKEVEKRNQDFNIQSLALRLDYTRKLTENINWDFGINLSQSDATANTLFERLASNSIESGVYDYTEDNYAFYAKLAGTHHKITYDLGLRLEQNNVTGQFRSSTEPSLVRNKLILFPKLNLNIPIDSTKTVSFNYGKTIRRPHYLNNSSISTYISPILEYTRNVNLLSSFYTDISVNLQISKHSIKLEYIEVENADILLTNYDEDAKRLIGTPETLEQERGIHLSFISPMNVKKWNSTLFLRFSYAKLSDELGVPTNIQPYLYFYNRQSIQLKHGLSTGLTIWGLTERKRALLEENAKFIAGLFVSKKFGKQFTVTLNYNDIFKSFNFENSYTLNQIDTNRTQLGDRNEISLALKYNFGKQFESNYKNEDIDENIKRIN